MPASRTSELSAIAEVLADGAWLERDAMWERFDEALQTNRGTDQVRGLRMISALISVGLVARVRGDAGVHVYRATAAATSNPPGGSGNRSESLDRDCLEISPRSSTGPTTFGLRGGRLDGDGLARRQEVGTPPGGFGREA